MVAAAGTGWNVVMTNRQRRAARRAAAAPDGGAADTLHALQMQLNALRGSLNFHPGGTGGAGQPAA
eukprot:7074685-Lingulodinium_polyedra.AAC.1